LNSTVLSLPPWQTAGDAANEQVWDSFGDDVAWSGTVCKAN